MYAGIGCPDDHRQLSFRGQEVDEKLFDVGLIKIYNYWSFLSLKIRDVGLIKILVNLLSLKIRDVGLMNILVNLLSLIQAMRVLARCQCSSLPPCIAHPHKASALPCVFSCLGSQSFVMSTRWLVTAGILF